MQRPLIVVGDKTDHGGTVIQGTPTSDNAGVPFARVGDRVTCPRKGHGGLSVIVSGDPTFIIDGAPVARHGDLCACGAKLLGSQAMSFVVEGDASGRGSAAGASVTAAIAPLSLDYDEQVELFTATAFVPGLPYYVKAGEKVVSGRVAQDQRLPRIEMANEDLYQIWIGDNALAMMAGCQ